MDIDARQLAVVLAVHNKVISIVVDAQSNNNQQQIITTANSSLTTCAKIRTNCSTRDGLIVPLWRPQIGISTGDKISRAIVYLFALIYLFIGVAIISDRFMAAIEVITSQKREIRKKNPDGTFSVTTVSIWNETVSNLTLMALGSSAPEILLSIIEVVGKNFESGDLGPGTIVGSAAFNLFVIIAICIISIPRGEVRRIRHLRVFFVTTTWSIFAYIWLWAIVAKITPGLIDVVEGTLTFLFFPLTVFSAYIVDTKVGNYLRVRITSQKRVQLNREGQIISEQNEMIDGDFVKDGLRKNTYTQQNETDLLTHDKKNPTGISKSISGAILNQMGDSSHDALWYEQVEQQRRQEFINIWKELRNLHPDYDVKLLNEMAVVEMMNRVPKSRAYYRIQATKRLGGGGNVKRKLLEKLNEPDRTDLDKTQTNDVTSSANITKIRFEPSHYTVLENAGYVTLYIVREGGNMRNSIYVDYSTEDGTATHGQDYVAAEGTLIFYPTETRKQIQIKIIDDEIFEEDEHFTVKLSNIRVKDSQGRLTPGAYDKTVLLSEPTSAIVMVIDDDHSGMFVFEAEEKVVIESDKVVTIKVLRTSGARGRVCVPYSTEDETAKSGKDYQTTMGEVIFENNEN
ncbi:unnamed protein product, partial [Didymodactylos carnosus]